MKKILRISKSSRKIEFSKVCNRVSEIVEKYNPDEIFIGATYTKLVDALPLLEEIKIKSYNLPFTATQKALFYKMDKATSVLMRYVNSMSKEPGNDATIESFFNFATSYLKGYGRYSSYRKLGIYSKMFQHLDADSGISQFINDNEVLSKLFATLKEDHAELENTYSLQRKARAEKVKVKTMEVKQTLFYRLADLFSSIEMAALGHPEVDYVPLIDELNQEVYQLKIGTRVKSMENTANIADVGLNNSEQEAV